MMRHQKINRYLLLRLIFILLGFFVLLGCTEGHNSSSSKNSVINSDTSISNTSKVVIISRSSVIPTNSGIGFHYLELGNFTGEDLNLSDVKLIDTVSEGLNKTRSNHYKFSKHMSSYKADNLDASGCVKLNAHSFCKIKFTPPSSDGSTVIELSYAGLDDKVYSVSQLVNYSSQVSSNNGFLLSNKDISEISSTNDILLSIPFVVEGNASNIVVNSKIKPIEQNLYCDKLLESGRHCTALLRLKAISGIEEISISGRSTLGKELRAGISINISYEDRGNIVITGGPVVIGGNDSYKDMLIVNNGTKAINSLSGLIESDNSSGATGLNTSNVSYINCNETGSTILESLEAGKTCQVQISRPVNKVNGFATYVVKIGGVDKASILVYYLQKKASAEFMVSIDNSSFVNVLSGQIKTRDVRVKNIGTDTISNISGQFLANAGGAVSASLSISNDASQSTCSQQNKTLVSGESCIYRLIYHPSAAESLNTKSIFKVSANTNGSSAITFSPQHQIIIYTSALKKEPSGELVALSPVNIATDIQPRTMAISANKKFAYLTNYGSHNIYMYNINESTGVLTIPNLDSHSFATESSPDGIAITPNGKYAYVTNYISCNISMYSINESTGYLLKMPVSQKTESGPVRIVVKPNGKFAYVINFESSTISMYSINSTYGHLTTLKPATIATGANPRSIVITPNESFVYVVNSGDNLISMYHIEESGTLSALSTPTIPTKSLPKLIAITPDGKYAYVTNSLSNNISMYRIDSSGQLFKLDPEVVATGSNPEGIAISPDGEFVYVSNRLEDSIFIYKINKDTGLLTPLNVSTKVNTGKNPEEITITPDGKFFYITNYGENTLSMYKLK